MVASPSYNRGKWKKSITSWKCPKKELVQNKIERKPRGCANDWKRRRVKEERIERPHLSMGARGGEGGERAGKKRQKPKREKNRRSI